MKKCIESVLNQECIFRIQVILVNDGSTDASGKILDYYKDFRIPGKDIVIIEKENGGLSSARNAGLARAKGKYLMFLDSDDSLTRKCVQKALSKAIQEQADFVQMQYIIKNGNIMYSGPHIREGVYNTYRDMCRIPGFAAMKIFRTELFDGVWFPEDYWFEDTLVHLTVFPRCKKGIVIPQSGYVYLKNTDGITQTKDGNPRSIETVLVTEKTILSSGYPEGYMDELLRHFTDICYHRLRYLPEEIIQRAFLVACSIVCKVDQEPSTLYRELYEAFQNRDYGVWKWYACHPSHTNKESL